MPETKRVDYAKIAKEQEIHELTRFNWEARSRSRDRSTCNYASVFLTIPSHHGPITIKKTGMSVPTAGREDDSRYAVHSESIAMLDALVDAKEMAMVHANISNNIANKLKKMEISPSEMLFAASAATPLISKIFYDKLLALKDFFNEEGVVVQLFTERKPCNDNVGYLGGCKNFLNALLPQEKHTVHFGFSRSNKDFPRFINSIYGKIKSLKKLADNSASASATSSSEAAALIQKTSTTENPSRKKHKYTAHSSAAAAAIPSSDSEEELDEHASSAAVAATSSSSSSPTSLSTAGHLPKGPIFHNKVKVGASAAASSSSSSVASSTAVPRPNRRPMPFNPTSASAAGHNFDVIRTYGKMSNSGGTGESSPSIHMAQDLAAQHQAARAQAEEEVARAEAAAKQASATQENNPKKGNNSKK